MPRNAATTREYRPIGLSARLGCGLPDVAAADLVGALGSETDLTAVTDSGLTQEWAPAVSPDGTKVAFYSYRDGNGEIYEVV